jgi:FixJ family two-component response regulator
MSKRKKSVVYVIEDDEDIRNEVSTVLESEGYIVSCHSSGEDFFKQWDGALDGCMLLDMRMPGMSGLDVLNKLGEATRILPVLLFTSVLDMQLAVQAGKSGVHDICPKPFTVEVLLAKIEDAIKVNLSRKRTHSDRLATIQSLTQMTARERDVLNRLCDGKSSKQIAEDLGISPYTVDNHRARIMDKLGANSVSQVVQLTLNARRPGED